MTKNTVKVGPLHCPVSADTTQFHDLKARAALAGWSIAKSGDGYVIGRWGLTKTLPDLSAVEAFIGRATGSKS